jgi:hypothetical protein
MIPWIMIRMKLLAKAVFSAFGGSPAARRNSLAP